MVKVAPKQGFQKYAWVIRTTVLRSTLDQEEEHKDHGEQHTRNNQSTESTYGSIVF